MTLNISIYLFVLMTVIQGRSSYRRVCYFTDWSRYRQGLGKYTVYDVEPFLCTHIVYAFGTFDSGGKVKPFDPGPDKKNWAVLSKIKHQNKHLKLLLALGGWNFGSVTFSNMAANTRVRSKFIYNTVDFLRKYDFDGLDIDWEYPAARGGVAADKTNLVKLCKELIDAFNQDAAKRGKDRLLLTAAVPANQNTARQGYDVLALSKYFDFINLMTYDFHGGWDGKTGFNSPLYAALHDPTPTFNMDAAAKWWHAAGFPKHKITVGFATYGRSFTLREPSNSTVGAPASTGPAGPYTRGRGFWAYYEICQGILKGGHVVFDSHQKVPYYVEDSLWIGYDNEHSFSVKAKWLKDNGYGGVMFWALDLDDFSKSCTTSTRTYPLIKTVTDILDGVLPVGRTSTPPEQPGTSAVVTQQDETTTTATTTATPTTTKTADNDLESFPCRDKSFVMYPDPLDCSKFYWCISGKTWSMSCPPTLVWDMAHSGCNYPNTVTLTYCQLLV